VEFDERFLTNSKRVGNREGLLGIIQGEIEKRRTEEWLDIFEGKGMPYAAIK
jgi:succinate--hydroxymethylglutarate CoA-transferase